MNSKQPDPLLFKNPPKHEQQRSPEATKPSMGGNDTEGARGGFSLINLKNTLISKIGGIFGSEEVAKKVEP